MFTRKWCSNTQIWSKIIILLTIKKKKNAKTVCMAPHACIHSVTAGQAWWGSRGSLRGSPNLLHMHQYIMSERCSAGFRSEEWEGRSEALPPKAVWPQEGRHRLHQKDSSKDFNVVPNSTLSYDTDLENLPVFPVLAQSLLGDVKGIVVSANQSALFWERTQDLSEK